MLGLIALTSLANAQKSEELSLSRIQKILIANRMVNLTHGFEKGIPHWPGFPDEKRETNCSYKGRKKTSNAKH